MKQEARKEFGKWLMDISKYMITALLLSSVFTDMDSPWILIMVILIAIAILAWGLYIIGGINSSAKKRKKGKRK